MARMLQFSKYFFMTLAALLLRHAGLRPGRRRHRRTSTTRSPPVSAWASPPASAASARVRATASATEALARNPGARPGIFSSS